MQTILNDIKNGVKGMSWYEWLMTAIMVFIAALAVHQGFTDPNSYNPAWLTIINFISAICGVFCVFLTAKASIGNFAFANVNTLVYIIFLAYHRNDGFTATLILETAFYMPLCGYIGLGIVMKLKAIKLRRKNWRFGRIFWWLCL